MNEFKEDEIFPDSLFQYQNGLNIQEWLEKRNCFLKDFEILSHKFSDYLICMCESTNINPKLILVSLQREQGLIAKSKVPAIEVLNRALGVGCYDDRDIKDFYGFQTQIDGCINTYIRWFNKPITPLKIDGKTIVPKNSFTHTIYKYTPHISAAQLTYAIWRGWFPADVV